MEVIKSHARPIRLFFFWSGIIATVAYRIIIVLNFYDPLWVKIAWYIGTVGFIIYFWHRFDIQTKRSKLVSDYDLVNAVEKTDCVSGDQKEALSYLVKTTQTSKARWNSAFIAILSVVALITGIILDVMKL